MSTLICRYFPNYCIYLTLPLPHASRFFNCRDRNNPTSNEEDLCEYLGIYDCPRYDEDAEEEEAYTGHLRVNAATKVDDEEQAFVGLGSKSSSSRSGRHRCRRRRRRSSSSSSSKSGKDLIDDIEEEFIECRRRHRRRSSSSSSSKSGKDLIAEEQRFIRIGSKSSSRSYSGKSTSNRSYSGKSSSRSSSSSKSGKDYERYGIATE